MYMKAVIGVPPLRGGVYELQSYVTSCSDLRWWWTGAYFNKEGETFRLKKFSSKKSVGKYFFELGQVGDPSISLINSLYFIREIRPKSPKIGHPPTFVGSKKYFPVKKKFLVFFSVEQLVVYFLFRYFIAPTDLWETNGATLKFIDPPLRGVLK